MTLSDLQNRLKRGRGYWIAFFLLLFLLMAPAFSFGDTPSPIVSVLVSRNIKPYIEMVEGLESVFSKNSEAQVRLFLMDQYGEKNLDVLKEAIFEPRPALLIAVGPEAARFLWGESDEPDIPRVYSMVLNPEKVMGESACGVSLSIPVDIQLQEIQKTLPSLRRIGVLYDPAHNADFFKEALQYGEEMNLSMVSLQVSSKKEIPDALASHWSEIDWLWLIPDRTVISESIVKYIIKEALLNRIPVIGYNRFFHDSGATFSFVFDYAALGAQTAQKALRLLGGEGCQGDEPFHEIWINERVIRKLDLPLANLNDPRVMQKP